MIILNTLLREELAQLNHKPEENLEEGFFTNLFAGLTLLIGSLAVGGCKLSKMATKDRTAIEKVAKTDAGKAINAASKEQTDSNYSKMQKADKKGLYRVSLDKDTISKSNAPHTEKATTVAKKMAMLKCLADHPDTVTVKGSNIVITSPINATKQDSVTTGKPATQSGKDSSVDVPAVKNTTPKSADSKGDEKDTGKSAKTGSNMQPGEEPKKGNNSPSKQPATTGSSPRPGEKKEPVTSKYKQSSTDGNNKKGEPENISQPIELDPHTRSKPKSSTTVIKPSDNKGKENDKGKSTSVIKPANKSHTPKPVINMKNGKPHFKIKNGKPVVKLREDDLMSILKSTLK